MPVKELIIKDEPVELKITDSNLKGHCLIKVNSGEDVLAVMVIDRNQADLLKLWLEEHLK